MGTERGQEHDTDGHDFFPRVPGLRASSWWFGGVMRTVWVFANFREREADSRTAGVVRV